MTASESPSERDLTEIFHQADWIRALSARLAGHRQDAEDLAQDVWVAALSDQAPAAPRRAWLRSVATRLNARRIRGDVRRRERERDAVDRRDADRADLESVRRYRALADAVLGLAEPYRSVIVMRFYEERDYAAIARAMKVSEATARQRVARACRMLRARLSPNRSVRALAGLLWFGRGGAIVQGVVMKGKLVAAASAAAVMWLAFGLWPDGDSGEASSGEVPRGLVAEAEWDPDEEPPEVGFAAEEPVAASRSRVASRPVAGRVLDVRGDVVAGARVVLLRPDGEPYFDRDEPESTDSVGRFAFARAVPSDHEVRLRIQADGYATRRVDGPGEDGEYVLDRLPILRGRLLLPDGNVAADVGRVEVGVRSPSGGLREYEAETTDGRFEIAGLQVGTIDTVWGRSRGYRAGELSPGVAVGYESIETIDIELQRGALVEGVVIDAVSEQPVAGAEVWCETHDYEPDSVEPTAIADGEGRFRLVGVAPDRFVTDDGMVMALVRMRARAPGYIPGRNQACAALWTEEEHYEFHVRVQPAGCDVTGLVRDVDGSPRSGLFVHLVDSSSNVHLTTTNRHGVFDLSGLPAGPAKILAREREFDDEFGARVAVTEARVLAGENRVDMVLVEPTGSIAGVYRDLDGPVANQSIELRLNLRTEALWVGIESRTAVTDERGRFRFDHVPPGDYELFPEWRTAGADRTTMPFTRMFEFAHGEHRDRMDFSVGEAMTVRGTLDAGEMAPDAFRLELRDPATGEAVAYASPDADGAFEFAPVLRGHYDAVVIRGGENVTTRAVTPSKDFTLHFEPR